MKYAVLGATGLLGHHAARAIRASGHDLVLIHRPSSQIQRLAYLEPECRVAEMLDLVSLTEQEAYALLRSSAMNQGKKIVDVAQALITASDLLGGGL